MLLLVAETGVAKSWTKTFLLPLPFVLSWQTKIYSFVFQFLAQTHTQKMQKRINFQFLPTVRLTCYGITFIEIESQKMKLICFVFAFDFFLSYLVVLLGDNTVWQSVIIHLTMKGLDRTNKQKNKQTILTVSQYHIIQ